MRNIIIASLFWGFYFTLPEAAATPWISTRYAQNCAGCHAPSRRNVAPKERRCTLACQGCHVNPSGGGMRNEYGVWNQQRWLRSFKSKTFKSKAMPAPLEYQKYAKMPKKLNPRARRKYTKMAKAGPPLVTVPGVDYDLEDYDKYDEQEQINVGTRAEFLARVTDNDPWRLERTKGIYATGDLRYFYFDGTQELSGSAGSGNREFDGVGPMGLDVAVRVKPMDEHLHVVFEQRVLNNPNVAGTESLEFFATGSGVQTRSFYALVDDLAWNTYVQFDLYRPLFGHYSPDHSTLLNHLIYADNRTAVAGNYGIQARAAQTINKVLSVGSSPNVPFVNLHYIQPMDDKTLPQSSEGGFALNLGGRFVTMGASIMLSYWSTKGDRGVSGGDELATDMYGISGGFTVNDWIVNLDFSTIEKEYEIGQADRGAVSTVEAKYRFWREMYAVLNYATANTTRTLKEGASSETMIGVKTFLNPGVEFELLQVSRTDRDKRAGSEGRIDTDMLQGQLHIYF